MSDDGGRRARLPARGCAGVAPPGTGRGLRDANHLASTVAPDIDAFDFQVIEDTCSS